MARGTVVRLDVNCRSAPYVAARAKWPGSFLDLPFGDFSAMVDQSVVVEMERSGDAAERDKDEKKNRSPAVLNLVSSSLLVRIFWCFGSPPQQESAKTAALCIQS